MTREISVWERETFFSPQDVVIAGSGFVGLWSAFYLKRKHPKLNVTIIEQGLIPTGASTRNAGFACFGSLSELVWDAQTLGNERMLQVTEMRFKGLQRIQKHFGKKVIDFDLCGGYELYEAGVLATDKLKGNIDYLNSLLKPITGAKKTYKLADERLATFGFGRTRHLVQNKLEGYLHSGKLLRELLRSVQSMGVTVLNGIAITNIEQEEKTLTLHTAQGFTFSTNQLLVCTNAFAKKLLPSLDIVPARGQVLLTSTIKHLPFNGTFHSDEGFYYFRNLGNKVLLGGARNNAFTEEETHEQQTTDFIQQELVKYLAETVLPHFQNQYKIEQRWAGTMAFGKEKLPIVKQVEKNIYCAVRMSGMGVALAPIVAEQVTQMMRD